MGDGREDGKAEGRDEPFRETATAIPLLPGAGVCRYLAAGRTGGGEDIVESFSLRESRLFRRGGTDEDVGIVDEGFHSGFVPQNRALAALRTRTQESHQ